MVAKSLPSVSELKSLFEYREKTGELIWRWRDRDNISDALNKRLTGYSAGTKNTHGYLALQLNHNRYLVHRIIWKIITGKEPAMLDHIDGNRSNNRIDNLREASRSENGCNRKIHKNNRSGFKGVHFHKGEKKFIANIRLRGKLHRLGAFDDPQKAAKCYRDFAKKIHGEFARMS